MAGRWLLFIGDSRGRIAYAAAVARDAGETPPGWPVHRVAAGDECEPHGWDADGNERWGYYSAGCMSRWKGGCLDDHRGRNVRKVCALDYVSKTRYTFVWHSLNTKLHMRSMLSRVHKLVSEASAPPDAVFLSTGLWDMQMASAHLMCPRMHLVLQALRAELPRTQIALLGFAPCPECPLEHDRSCYHWGRRRSKLTDLMAGGEACGLNATRAADASYLDVGKITGSLPNMRSSPCGTVHLFGAGSEGVISQWYASLAGLPQATTQPVRLPNATELRQFWSPGTYRMQAAP